MTRSRCKGNPAGLRSLSRRQFARRSGHEPPPHESDCPPTPDDGRCQCCRKPRGSGKRLALDHDHVTGHFRGWLCAKCNRGIGALGDDLRGVLLAVEYLKRAAELPPYGFVNPDSRPASTTRSEHAITKP